MNLAQSTGCKRVYILGWVHQVLDLAGMELSSEQLVWCCFGFVAMGVLITHQCFARFWMMLAKPQGFFPQ